jgi:hypothetical protein
MPRYHIRELGYIARALTEYVDQTNIRRHSIMYLSNTTRLLAP